eukprot:scaffold5596_cov148-Chaetoceros_neogracile.AAC.1
MLLRRGAPTGVFGGTQFLNPTTHPTPTCFPGCKGGKHGASEEEAVDNQHSLSVKSTENY